MSNSIVATNTLSMTTGDKTLTNNYKGALIILNTIGS